MKTFNDILKQSNSALAKILQKNQDAQSLSKIFKSIVDPDIAKNCKFASFDGITVNIIVKNAAWATRVRYSLSEILKTLKAQPEFRAAKSIRYSLDKHVQTAVTPGAKPFRMSKSNTKMWREMLSKIKNKAHNMFL